MGTTTKKRKATESAAIYCRISNDPTGREEGVERQESLCRELAARDGIEVVAVYVDNDVSAYRKNVARPQYDALLDAARAGRITHLYAYQPDRIYRAFDDLEELVKLTDATGLRIRTVATGTVDLSSANGLMVARILGATAAAESHRISERRRASNDYRAIQGLPPSVSTPAYGYVRSEGTTLHVDPETAAIVREIADRIGTGETFQSIADDLTARGVPTPRDRIRGSDTPSLWRVSMVKAAATNPTVYGWRVHRGTIATDATGQPIRGTWDPILTEEHHRRIVARSTPHRTGKRPRKALLTGLLYDIEGNGLAARIAQHGRRVYAGDTSSRRKTARTVVIGADDLDAYIERVTEVLLDNQPPVEPPTATADSARSIDYAAELAEITAAYRDEAITFGEYMALTAPLRERMKAAPSPLSTAPRVTGDEFRDRWPSMTTTERRALLATVWDRITVHPGIVDGRRLTIDERVELVPRGHVVAGRV